MDFIFSGVVNVFRSCFTAIPETALPCLIGIFFYALITWVIIWVDKEREGELTDPKAYNPTIAMSVYSILLIFTILFALWRIGIAFMIDPLITDVTISQFAFNLIFLIFGLGVFYAFYRNSLWLKRAIIGILWLIFVLLVWVICPATNESVLTDNTMYQFAFVVGWFLIPESIVYKRRKNKQDILEKRGSRR